jgi:hypothetical protein
MRRDRVARKVNGYELDCPAGLCSRLGSNNPTRFPSCFKPVVYMASLIWICVLHFAYPLSSPVCFRSVILHRHVAVPVRRCSSTAVFCRVFWMCICAKPISRLEWEMGPGTTCATAGPHKETCTVLVPHIESKPGVLHSRPECYSGTVTRHFSSHETRVALFLFPRLQSLKAAADISRQYRQSDGFLFAVASSQAQADNVTNYTVWGSICCHTSA